MKIRDVLGKSTTLRPVDGAFVGLDIGSRASKGVLLHGDEITTAIVPTGLYTQETADELLGELLILADLERRDLVRLVGTGYGRIALDYADLPFEVITEIKCHAMGAHVAVPGTRTIIDIGGQDSKAIKVEPSTGKVLEFVMNDKCAAGTGRFLEKSAQTLGVELEDLGRLVAASSQPSVVSSQCVVFAETEIITLRAKAEGLKDDRSLADIAAGIHVSAARRVQNLLGRIGIERELVFTGGVSNNPGMRKVLEELLGHTFTLPSLDLVFAGALGAAVYAARSASNRVTVLGSRSLPVVSAGAAPELALAATARAAASTTAAASAAANAVATAAAASASGEPAWLAELHALIERRKAEFIEKQDGRKRFAYQCNYSPLELLSASGGRHIRLFRAGDPETVARGERYTQSIYCDSAKSCLGFFAAGDPLYGAVDGVYNFYTCNTVKRISEVLDRFVPVKLLNLPKLRHEPSSRAFFRLELEDMKRDLEAKTGQPITDEILHGQIVRHNRLRRLLRKISDLRKLRRPPLTGRQFLELVTAYYYLEADEAIAAYEKIHETLLASVGDQEGEEPLRLLISGSELADGDRKVHDILEGEFGGLVVAEDVCTGVRPFCHELPETGDPMEALVAGYLDQAPCARMKPLGEAAQFAADLAVEYRADGVLYTYLKFCPTHSVGMKEYLTAFQRAALPVLELSNDYSQSSGGQIRTRIEAFVEVLQDKRARCGSPALAAGGV
jgi:predicted CoA-substrate-specific enzyme activase